MSSEHDAGAAPEAGGGAEEVGYAAAVAELEQILAELESDDVDVDVLAAKVRRAATLLAVCRTRIDAARFEVTRVVADLDGVASPGADGSEGDDVLADPDTDAPDGVAGG